MPTDGFQRLSNDALLCGGFLATKHFDRRAVDELHGTLIVNGDDALGKRFEDIISDLIHRGEHVRLVAVELLFDVFRKLR